MKLGQLFEYNKINIFLRKLCRKGKLVPDIFWAGRLVPDIFFFLKSLIWGNSKWSASEAYNTKKVYETLDCWARDMLHFKFSEKDLGLVFHQVLCMVFQENVSHVKFYWLNKSYCLIFLNSRDIGQYVCYNCLLTRLWRHKTWN